ncbi:hypothetical protein [Burkholderia pseudomallei]|uniref:hypothetical protein n=1 Tax=Burkholderia pseudomallei TaxID=28450 RepID=UPI00016B179A|nr:hypothetical protein [Burkholderia pseudomallei]AGZ31937.1 gp39 domain protein [Burkholderia pseudomallei NCTC 13179]
MSDIKHTPFIADGKRIRLENGTHIATVWVEYPDEDRLDGESWIDMRQRTALDRELAEITATNRAKEFAAVSDMLMALELLATEADAGTAMIPSGLRLAIDAALIKAGRKEAPEPVRHVTIAGVRDE